MVDTLCGRNRLPDHPLSALCARTRGFPIQSWRNAHHLQPGAAARESRPGAAPHVSAEANTIGAVPFGSVYLTGKLTRVYAGCQVHIRIH